MNRDDLLEQLTEDILAYAMHGSFPEQELARSIKPEQLDERFEEYELLLDLHFILQDDVVEFFRELPAHLRSIRTETQTTSRTRRGTVDGRINWGKTIKKRYAEHPRDRSLYVCENRSEDYDIPENIVLKRLISVVHETIREAAEYLRGDYEWVTETWKGSDELIDELQRIVERNVHVRRIREPDTYEPTERMLTTAANSRHEVYRDAASLLRSRERLFRGEPDAIRQLLEETAIAPDDQDTLFELFVLFRFVATLEEMRETQPEFKTIATDRQELARFEGEKEIVLYHDNSARDRELSFVAVPDEDKAELSRTDKVQVAAQEIAGNYFRKDYRNHTGRPDVIVLEVISEDENEHEYLIVEVKNSTREATIRQGIKETLEYLAFLRVNDEFVFGQEDGEYFGSGWNGMLVVQDLDQDTASVEGQKEQEIAILQASELEEELESVLRDVV
ncbi:hypothetical protein SAMN05444422_109158 [Halobiforma haloterrestris]|uniref:Uncharacterized protein n=1 Tax=Natronobacterium haloterrestre TaxID=148448 RepID=A0A1I1JRE8_NATHA|nr:hypothetical protein [Halobiforma haloterrestris]SFC51134.1 hypothetical protein SAMN05444422_109158 [Halobiforma haloterrestris]